MQLFFTCLSTILVLSCSPERADIPLEKFSAQAIKTESDDQDTFLEVQLHQYYLARELSILNKELDDLVAEIESGNEDKVYELEEVQYKIQFNKKYQSFNDEFIAALGIPKLPPRPVPNPCEDPGEELNCPKMIPANLSILITNEQEVNSIGVLNARGELIEEFKQVEPLEHYTELLTYQLNSNFSGEGFLQVSKYSQLLDTDITYTIAIIIE